MNTETFLEIKQIWKCPACFNTFASQYSADKCCEAQDWFICPICEAECFDKREAEQCLSAHSNDEVEYACRATHRELERAGQQRLWR